MGGVVLLMEHTIRPGDILLLDGEPVRVMHMRLRVSIVRDPGGRDLVLPNRVPTQERVTLRTLDNSRHRLRARLQMAYTDDVTQVRAVLNEAVVSLPRSDGEPEIRMVYFEDSGVRWEVQVWSDEPWKMEVHRSELHADVLIVMMKHSVMT